MGKNSLAKLLNRNLSASTANEKRKERIKLAKKAQKLRAKKVEVKKPVKPQPKDTPENKEIEELKREISKELKTQPTYTKRQYRLQPTFEGLTPGLAPVGYDPDESDSEDEPY